MVRTTKVHLLLAVLAMLVLTISPAACGGGTDGSSTSQAADTTVAPPTTASTLEMSTTSTESSGSEEPLELTVSAAAGLKAAFTKIGDLFDQKNNVKTIFNFAASGVLQNQIEGGAPVDVFASADPKNMNALVEKSLVDASSVKAIAGNEIVLIVPADSTLGLAGFEDLARPEVKRLATGNPDSTPLGAATLKILPQIGIEAAVKPKLIFTETVSQTLEYVSKGEVDAGIVWSSEAQTGGAKVKVVARADRAWYGEAKFVVGTVNESQNKDLGQAFIDFVLGPDGQAILQSYGFLKPPVG